MASLEFTAAACKLAVALYHARAEAYGLAIDPWETLPAHERHGYIDEAALSLESVKPLAPRKVVGLSEFLQRTAIDALTR